MYGRIGHRLPLGFYGSVGAPINLRRRSKRPIPPSAQTTTEFVKGLKIFSGLMLLGLLVGVAATSPFLWVPLLILTVLAVIGTIVESGKPGGKPPRP